MKLTRLPPAPDGAAEAPGSAGAQLWQEAVRATRTGATSGPPPQLEVSLAGVLGCFSNPEILGLAEQLTEAADNLADHYPTPAKLQPWAWAGALGCWSAVLLMVERDTTLRFLREHWATVHAAAAQAGFGDLPSRPMSKHDLTLLRDHLADLRVRSAVESELRRILELPSSSRSRTKYRRDTAAETILDLTDNVLIYNLFEQWTELAPPQHEAGPARDFPPALLFICATAARAVGSHSAVEQLLHSDGYRLWQRMVEHAARMGVHDVPAFAPTTDQWMPLYTFMAARIERVLQVHGQLSVRQAQRMGSLLPGRHPDWACPDHRHVVTGDGTYWLVYTAKTDGPRAPKMLTNARLDGKQLVGRLNLIAMSTWTPHGAYVLDVDRALGGESENALPCLERIIAAADGGVHTVVYDGALTGWLLDWLAAAYGVLTVGKNVAAEKTGKVDDQVLRHFSAAATRRLEQQGLAPTDPAYRRRLQTLTKDLYCHDDPLEVGCSRYPTNRGIETVHSHAVPYRVATHKPFGDDRNCVHHLWVDDGALCDVELGPNDKPIKIGYGDCISAVPRVSSHGEAVEIRMQWLIPCSNGSFEETIIWRPRNIRGKSATRNLTARQTAERLLRPINRVMAAMFTQVYGVRSVTESHNHKVKRQAVYLYERLASVDPDQALLDWLCMQLVHNSGVVARHQRTQTTQRVA